MSTILLVSCAVLLFTVVCPPLCTHILQVKAPEMAQVPPPLLPSFDSPIGHMAYLPPAATPEVDHQGQAQSAGKPAHHLAAASSALDTQQQVQDQSALNNMRHFSLANMESFLPMQPVLDTSALVAPEAASALASMADTTAADPAAGTSAQA